MIKTLIALIAAGTLVLQAVPHLRAQAPTRDVPETLEVYFIDTEGGQATLLVTPSRESLLVDTGFAGGRDADRIVSAMKLAGISVLDYVVITHYHGDHVGGAAELAAKVPIRHFIDHGPYTVELQPNRVGGFAAYKPLRDMARAIVAKPGDTIPLQGLDVQFVTSAGQLISSNIGGAPGAGVANPLCRDARLKTPDPTPENTESLGLVVRFGRFRMLNLGDLTWNQEHRLVCPNNLLGTFDLFHTTRHGDPNSGAPQMVHAIRARAAVMNNGERKGGSPEYWQTVHDAPGLEDLWQLHRSAAGGAAHNSADQFLANVNETDHGHHLHMSVRTDRSFTITNSRTGFTKAYAARR
jgi:beta-lactamase superfamily II metal-dependent hydrolase